MALLLLLPVCYYRMVIESSTTNFRCRMLSCFVAVCLCFSLSILSSPLKSALNLSIGPLGAAEKAFNDGSMGIDQAPVKHFVSTRLIATADAEHVMPGADQPCDNPGCEDIADCEMSCTPCTQCPASVVFGVVPLQLTNITLPSSSQSYRRSHQASIASRQSAPPLRPPIS